MTKANSSTDGGDCSKANNDKRVTSGTISGSSRYSSSDGGGGVGSSSSSSSSSSGVDISSASNINNRSNLKQAKNSNCDREALDKNSTSTVTAQRTLSNEFKNYEMLGMHKDIQDLLESDLSCAICQDIYINPLLLNCSHSFCKFCVFRWLSKKTVCPQCRMTVQFQAENLALRNIINRMVQKASPQFQAHRTNSVNQRLKDEEAQEKDGTNGAVLKNSSQSTNGSGRRRANQHERNDRHRDPSFILRVFPSPTPPNMDASDFDAGDFMTNSSDSSEASNASFDLFRETIFGSRPDNNEDDGSNDMEPDEVNDVTFEINSNASSSEDDDNDGEMDDSDDEDMFDESWADLNETSESDPDFELEDEEYDEEGEDADDNEDSDDAGDEDEEFATDSDDSTAASTSSSSDDDESYDASLPPNDDLFIFSLPDMESDPGTVSDESTEEYSIDSSASGSYSRESTIEYGTSDDSD